MAPVDTSELRAVITNSPSRKAPGPSSIPYEWFKLLSSDGISYLCQLMNLCLVSADIPEDWRLASIVPIPKPHEFECLLKNTHLITLLETARKLLVKIITNRLSKVMATHQVLTGDNFAGLPGSSVTTPINVLDGIMKSHRISSSSQELWILSQDISKAFNSIDLGMLKLRIDQGEIIFPLLWTIYFDPLLTELSTAALAPYIWSSGIPKNILSINNNEDIAVPISQLTYMDDSTLISSSLDGLNNLLSIARDFYFLNNITANFQKYELVSSKSGNTLVTFNLISEISNHLLPLSFSLQALKLSMSFRFLGVWFNLQGFSNFVLSQVKDIYSNFMASISLISAGSKYANWVLITLRTLQGSLKWPSSLDSINDFSLWTSKRRSISHNWLFQTIKLIRSIGLQFDFPDNTFLDLMPNESCPLLKSVLWCLSQLLDPFRRFQYSWMDLKKMGLVANTSRIPFWFKEISSIPNLFLLFMSPLPSNISITPPLLSLIGKFVDKIDEVTHIRLRNKYYWIAGLDSSNALIFGRAFYTFDDSSENRVIYFSHWISGSHDRMVLTPCPGCSLHCLEDNDGPLALKSVGGKLIHRSCLSILPSYRCLNLYQMTAHIDLSQQFINLKLSPFILCSYFRFLLGFSEMYIPEQFFVMDTSSIGLSDDSPTHVPLDLTPVPSTVFALNSNTHFHIVGIVVEGDPSTSYLKCAWVQTLDDFILESGVFSCPMVSPYSKDVAELTFIVYVLNSLPSDSVVEFSSQLPLQSSYHNWMNASPAKRTRLKNNFLWSCISELMISKRISCGFNGLIKGDPVPPYLVRALDLIKESAHSITLRLTLLMDVIFPSSLKTLGLFTSFDELLTQDPIAYWQSVTDIKNFFSLLGLSRFTMLQTSFHAVDWALSFDTFQQLIYPRFSVSSASAFLQFRLKLWFDELPIMYRLCQRFPGLYADDSLCPNCGIFIETLEHLFSCSPSFLDAFDSNPEPLQHKDITVELIQRFIIKLATRISHSPACKRTYEELLSALRNLDSLGLPSLFSASGDSSFSASWFLRGFIPRDLLTFLMRYSSLKYGSVSSIISRTFLKLQREIYHGLWRPRCKIKIQQDLAKGITPSALRSYKGPSVQPFRFSAPKVILSPADAPLSPLQTSEWASLESNSPHLESHLGGS
ncbi:hypothetical protein RhiirA4_474044 [Rhizophagus irregularis]|uniref:Reverse transcriptase domain-containing protein n=1 Tax=Rhizophagus irregularis TaxID=588596 RepID=A0A2I1H7S6_9GLOM|nr:hypothetical protein RhiirA4_474044 [Rhizophagus irregularis]